MASVNQKFVLVGPHAGQTMHVNGHEFVDGEMTFQGSAEQAATLERVFEFYGAMTAEKAELHALRGEQKPAKPASQTTAPAAPVADAQVGKPTLGEAIGALDPENDKHWTSNNLPALDVLEELTGKKVARDEVNSVADGYTRAKARAAKQ